MNSRVASAMGLALFIAAPRVLAADVPVSNVTALTAAIAAAKPGDTIILAAGTYASTGFNCTAVGTTAQPIKVRSATPLAAKLELNSLEGFKVSGANWQFEGLDIRGVCATDSACEHAFHVTGAATGFVLRNNRIYDFNAQLKVNASQIGGVFVVPHGGLIEGNELFDSKARNTSNPTTKLNIDTGDDWIVRANVIHDFQKGGGDGVSYAAFMKSGGKRGLFERNLVMCARDFTGGTRLGLSFGGGGTAPQFCAPAFDANVPCTPEHDGGTMQNNIIANCSDVGIYLNKAKDTKLLHNTLIGTAGIDYRFAASTGEARANVLTGSIRLRDGGTATMAGNLTSVTTATFAAMYMDPLKGDLRKKGDLAALIDKALSTTVQNDYCFRTRAGTHDLGALEHSLGDCTTTTPPGGGTTTPGDAGSDGSTGSDGSIAADTASDVPQNEDAAFPVDTSSSSDAPAVDDAGDDAALDPPSSADDGGCSCRVGTRTNAMAMPLAVALLALLALRRARARLQREP